MPTDLLPTRKEFQIAAVTFVVLTVVCAALEHARYQWALGLRSDGFWDLDPFSQVLRGFFRSEAKLILIVLPYGAMLWVWGRRKLNLFPLIVALGVILHFDLTFGYQPLGLTLLAQLDLYPSAKQLFLNLHCDWNPPPEGAICSS